MNNKKFRKRRRRHKRISDNDSGNESSDSDAKDIRVTKNHIYFWTDVNKKTALDLTIKITDSYNNIRSLTLPGDEPTPIYIHINSYGGDTDAALGVVDTIQSLKDDGAKIITIVEGNASSAATMISIVGSERRIRPNAYMRVHNFSTVIGGKKNDLDEEYHNLGKLEDLLIDFYRDNTTMNKKQVKKIMAKETDLRPKECIEKGLVDSIQR
jgi:ATP-dependent protease ClpP protease subunit